MEVIPGGNRGRIATYFHHHERIDMKRLNYWLFALVMCASLLLPAMAGTPAGHLQASLLTTSASLAPVSVVNLAGDGTVWSPSHADHVAWPSRSSKRTASLAGCPRYTSQPGFALTPLQERLRINGAVERRCEGRAYS